MLQDYYRFNEVTGISILLDAEGISEMNVCSISVAQNKLNFEKKIIGLKNHEALKQNIPAKTIVALNLTGKGILIKQIEKTEEINQNNFNKILPNATISDFYVQNFISGEQSFVSVIRKSEADRWINQITESGYVPFMLSLGPFPVQNIIPQLNIYGNAIVFGGHSITRNDTSAWESYHFDENASAPFPIKAESEVIPEKLLIPYAVAFQLILHDKVNLINADVPELADSFIKQVNYKKFKVQGFIILSVFFMLLLINFILFSSLNTSNGKLTEQVSRTAQSTEDVEKVNEQVQQKEGLLKTLGYEGAINKSVLIDQIASLLPEEITWKEVAIDPIDLNTSRNQKSVAFYSRKIRVTGISDKIIPVNEWIARIKTRPWVKNVQWESYAINSELETGQFVIVIDY